MIINIPRRMSTRKHKESAEYVHHEINKLKVAFGVRTQKALAKAIGLSEGALSMRVRRGKVPWKNIISAAIEKHVDLSNFRQTDKNGIRTADSEPNKNVDNSLNLLQRTKEENPPRRISTLVKKSYSATDLASTQKAAEPKAHYGEALPPEVRAAFAAEMPKVKEATAVAMRIAAHFGIGYMARTVTELQTLAYFGADEKHLTALIEAIIENEAEIRAAAERRATPDRPEPTPEDPAGQ